MLFGCLNKKGFAFRPFRIVLFALAAGLLMCASACAALSAQDIRERSPREFVLEATVALRDFTAKGTLTRTANGEYSLLYHTPETISGLSYVWISGEVTRGLHNSDEVVTLPPDDFFPLLVNALEAFYGQEELEEAEEEGMARFVYKEFTIEASRENGRILNITFPKDGISVQMDEKPKDENP